MPIIEKGRVAGFEDAEVTAKAMLEFVDRVKLFKDTAHVGTAHVGRDTKTAPYGGLYNRARNEKSGTK